MHYEQFCKGKETVGVKDLTALVYAFWGIYFGLSLTWSCGLNTHQQLKHIRYTCGVQFLM